jgi:hypothetical protein
MMFEDVHFLTANRVNLAEQKTLSLIVKPRKNAFFHSTEMSAPVDNTWEDDEVSNDSFPNQLKPVLCLLRALGLLPIKMSARGK